MDMTLPAGTKLGRYEIRSLLGVGGMGEVYRATDPKIGRDVAIKVLPADFAADKERVARFEQEAQAAGALNHPNILAIHDVDEQDGLVYVVSELLDGQELRDVLNEGFIPLRKVTDYSQQLVSGLTAAHEKGIVHRDLKPENIFITSDDRVKILDFGLAKLRAPDTDVHGSEDATRRAITDPGVIMGTVGYMSPEQVRGQATDYRSDIFSFGAILHEMITGKRAFQEETMAETMAAIIKQEPEELTASRPEINPGLERIVRRCLEKKPERRFQSTSDLGFAIESLSAPTSLSGRTMMSNVSGISEIEPSVIPSRRSWLPLGLLGVLVLGAVAVAGWVTFRRAEARMPTTHLSIPLPEGHAIVSGPAISRDGHRVAFVSTDGVARPQLYVRDLDEADSRLMPGTEEADRPFFSPDGQWIAFYAKNQLYKVKVDGGAPVALAPSASNVGGTWTDAGTIIYKRSWSGGFEIISENGGESKPFLTLDSPDEYAYVWPYAIPGSADILFTHWGKTLDLLQFDPKNNAKRTVVSQWWRRFAYTPWGYVGAAEDGELRAAKIASPGSAQNNVVTVVKGVATEGLEANDGSAYFDVSQNGTLVYMRKVQNRRSVAIVDRQGQAKPIPLPEGEIQTAVVSPDGHRAAIVSSMRIEIVDLDRGTKTPLVPEMTNSAQDNPVWSPDARSVAFSSNHEGNWNIYSKPASGAGSVTTLLNQPLDQDVQSSAPDGTLLVTNVDPKNGAELWMLPPGSEPRVWLSNGFNNYGPRFSPDGRLVAYFSNISGRFEVYVQSRDNPADRVQVSASGGKLPQWSPDGKQLFFRQGNAMMETTIGNANGLTATAPVQVFDGGWTLPQWYAFDVMPDGQHFLMIRQPREAVQTHIDVVLNWFPALKQALGES